eukprot:6203043-Pleurochrysis_carterae.AAC.1
MEQRDNALRLASEASDAAAKLKKNVNVLEKQCERQVVKIEVAQESLDSIQQQLKKLKEQLEAQKKDAAVTLNEEKSRFDGLECNYLGRIDELEELITFQEAEFGKSMKLAEEKAKALKKASAVPAEHEWASLSEGGARWARKVDVDFLVEKLTEREWRPADVTTALHRADMLGAVFD